MNMLENGSAAMHEQLLAMGLTPRQTEALLPELQGLSARQRRIALSLAGRLEKRAAEALRAALDTLPQLTLDSPALALLDSLEPGLALTFLRSLPWLDKVLGPQGLNEWLNLARGLTQGQQAELAQRGPALLGGLGNRLAAKLALRLASHLSERAGGNPLAALRLVSQAAHGQRRPHLILGLAYRLARQRPESARSFLQNIGTGPAARLTPQQLCAWVVAGLRVERLATGFFSEDSLTGLAEADRLSGGLSLRRLFPWLGPYASLHGGRSFGLETREGEPSLPHFDLHEAALLTLPARLPPGCGDPHRLARALAVLAARTRLLGLYDLESGQVLSLLQTSGRSAPALHQLSPPALFCSGFASPLLAAALLALAAEQRIRQELAPRLPGLQKDFLALDRLRRESPPPWPALEPAERVLGLLIRELAGGDKPAQVLPGDHELALELAQTLRRRAPWRGPLELMSLAAEIYGRLPEASAQPGQRLPQPLNQSSPGPGGQREEEPEAGPNTPLSNKHGPGADGAPPPWDLEVNGQRDRGLAEHRYPEWDPAMRRLTTGRALVVERNAPRGDATELRQALANKARLASALERAFLTLAPSQPAWNGKSDDGPELDMGALVAERAEALAGFSPRGLVFRRRLPRLRQVSCGVLWDVSGSTRRNLDGGQSSKSGRAQLYAAREALALFARALTAAGDEFALWAYSGVGPERVDFYLLKTFAEPWNDLVRERLAGIKPMAQNRDGAAIRHATRLLAGRSARQRLLIIITDGKPDDYGYGAEVAGRDLPLALGAARAQGVHPVAVLLTPEGRRPHIAYGQVPHLILKDLEGLGRWLPKLYRRMTT
ncbi:hypothetical protein AAU61_18410 [Desulfocarbo indianensis]|nr:hypothetical protein AAU61_18410 [Desulfocarbo indianensis]